MLGRLGHRRVVVVADQAVSSLGNVIVAIIVARVASPEQFGAFSVAMVAYQVATGAVRAVVGEPWLSAHSTDEPAAHRRASADLLRAGLATSVAAGLLVAAFGLVAGGAPRGPLLVLALIFPVLGVQDGLRFVAVVDRPRVALASDLAWLVAVVPLLAMAPDGAGPAWFVAAWGAGAVVGLAVAVAALDVPFDGGSARRWLDEHREMSGAFFGEFATARAAGQLVLLGLGAIAGLAALGAVRAAQVFYGPLNTLFSGIFMALVPDGARRRHDPRALTRLMLAASGVVTAAAAAWTVVGVVVPDAWGTALFGDTWREAEDVLLPIGLATVAGAVPTGAFAGIRSLGAARLSFRVRLWSMPPQVACALVGAAAGAAVGYAWGFALGNVVVATMWWVFFASALRGVREGAAAPVAAPAPSGAEPAVGLG